MAIFHSFLYVHQRVSPTDMMTCWWANGSKTPWNANAPGDEDSIAFPTILIDQNWCEENGTDRVLTHSQIDYLHSGYVKIAIENGHV